MNHVFRMIFGLACIYSQTITTLGVTGEVTIDDTDMAQQKLNFIVILCDDLGIEDLSFYGNKHISTPNIDALANASAQFSQFTVNPVCAPSRATFLTGWHFLRAGVSHVHGGREYIHRDVTLLPQRLKLAGYRTGMWGKWHNGNADGYLPWQRGFDEVYMADLYRHADSRGVVQSGERVAPDGWADEVIFSQAMDFIKRNKDEPFFAFLPSLTPHQKHAAPVEYVNKYFAAGHSEAVAKLFGMIEYLDVQVGHLMAFLDETGLSQNTVVIFLSDNGPNRDGNLTAEERALRQVTSMKGWKGDIWERGVRSPLFIWQPTIIGAKNITEPVKMADLFVSICELAGIPASESGVTLDGNSLVPLLLADGRYQGEYIFNYANVGWPPSDRPYSMDGIRDEYRPISVAEKTGLPVEEQVISIRDGDFKLLLNADLNRNWQEHPSEDYFLADLRKDPSESINFLDEYPRIFNRLKRQLRIEFEQLVNAPHSFSAPVFTISDVELSTKIPAVAPSKISDTLLNTVNRLKGWSTKGDYAEYQIITIKDKIVSVRFDWANDTDASNYMRISLDGRTDAGSSDLIELARGEYTLRVVLDEDISEAANLKNLYVDVLQ